MMLLALLATLAAPQEVPVYSDGQHVLDRMSADVSAHVAKCGVRVTFLAPKGGRVKDAKAVIDQAATADQIACAKGMVSWLITWDEARKAGIVK